MTYCPDAVVLASSSAVVRLHRILPGDWGIGFGIRHSEYAKTISNVASVSIERYWSDYRFVYRLRGGKADRTDVTLSHELRGDYYYKGDSMVALSIADGTESEQLSQSNLVSTEIKSLSIFGLHRLGRHWSVFWKLSQLRQGDLYDSKGAGIELHYRF
ncbi:MAG: YaiO family outer membrane beta-barrel protein [Bacteroidetes bacterium]|nr:MAG: YaiO family outer membrane beta-barrel protein [Bacteroidota bacterium]